MSIVSLKRFTDPRIPAIMERVQRELERVTGRPFSEGVHTITGQTYYYTHRVPKNAQAKLSQVPHIKVYTRGRNVEVYADHPELDEGFDYFLAFCILSVVAWTTYMTGV